MIHWYRSDITSTPQNAFVSQPIEPLKDSVNFRVITHNSKMHSMLLEMIKSFNGTILIAPHKTLSCGEVTFKLPDTPDMELLTTNVFRELLRLGLSFIRMGWYSIDKQGFAHERQRKGECND